jgi:hypothetical protein
MIIVETVCDMEKGRPKLHCNKPPGLQHYRWVHSHKFTYVQLRCILLIVIQSLF